VVYCAKLVKCTFWFWCTEVISGINDLDMSKTTSFSWGVDASIGNGVLCKYWIWWAAFNQSIY
jgi:hypothetical protein